MAQPLRVFITGASSGIGAARDFIDANGGADVVIASAGISHGTLTERPEHLPLFASVFATNVNATIAAFAPFIGAMKAQPGARRLEMRPYGIRVVTIAPGYIDTPMTSNNRFPMPFLMPAERFAARAVDAIGAGARFRVIPWQMGLVARLLRVLPNFIFDALFARAPQKARKEAA